MRSPAHLLTLLQSATVAVALSASVSGAQQAPPGSEYQGEAFEFRQVRENVYVGIPTGNLSVLSNAGVVINENDVLVVDSHVSPAAAYALLRELREVTDKPVRYVVNSHYHFDHAHGNQIYPETVEVIGHEFTRERLIAGASNVGRTRDRFLGGIPAQITSLRAQLDTATVAATRESLQRRLQIQEQYKLATDAVQPTPPTVTMNDRMTLHRGGREIRLEFFGRGHTGGDIVVFLPEEKVLLTGDLLTAGTSYMGDAYVPEWIETLERLKDLDFEVVIPGHGAPFTDRSQIDNFQAYLADFWGQVSALHRAGVAAPDAARQIDLRAHAVHYAGIRAVGIDTESVIGAYEILDGVR